jgi:hypothetical protein
MKSYIAACCVVGGLLFSTPLTILAEEVTSIKLLPVVPRGALSILPFAQSQVPCISNPCRGPVGIVHRRATGTIRILSEKPAGRRF